MLTAAYLPVSYDETGGKNSRTYEDYHANVARYFVVVIIGDVISSTLIVAFKLRHIQVFNYSLALSGRDSGVLDSAAVDRGPFGLVG